MIYDVLAVSHEPFADFRIASFKAIRVATTQTDEEDLLGGKHEVVTISRWNIQPGQSNLPGHLGCRLVDRAGRRQYRRGAH